MAALTAPAGQPDWPARPHPGTGGGRWWSADHHQSRRLVVVAHTPHGIVAAHPHWPAMLDGILCWVDRHVQRGVRPGQHDHHHPSMPVTIHGAARKATWMASRGWWQPDTTFDARPWGRRTDEQAHRQLASARGRINTSTGPDKSLWQLDAAHATPTVTWRAVGVADELARWLRHVPAVGDSGSRGQGVVARWEITDAGPPEDADSDLRWVALWAGSGQVMRPLRPRLAAIIGHDGSTVPGSPKPPYVHPAGTSVGRRDWVPVLSPWGCASCGR